MAPRRITWDSIGGKLVIERQEFRGPVLLERMHRRRGYQQPYAVEDTWAFSVDVAVVAMVFWSLSGLWLWWEIRPARRWGALSASVGVLLFALSNRNVRRRIRPQVQFPWAVRPASLRPPLSPVELNRR